MTARGRPSCSEKSPLCNQWLVLHIRRSSLNRVLSQDIKHFMWNYWLHYSLSRIYCMSCIILVVLYVQHEDNTIMWACQRCNYIEKNERNRHTLPYWVLRHVSTQTSSKPCFCSSVILGSRFKPAAKTVAVTSGCYQQYHPFIFASHTFASVFYNQVSSGRWFWSKWLENCLFQPSPSKYMLYIWSWWRKKKKKKGLKNM